MTIITEINILAGISTMPTIARTEATTCMILVRILLNHTGNHDSNDTPCDASSSSDDNASSTNLNTGDDNCCNNQGNDDHKNDDENYQNNVK